MIILNLALVNVLPKWLLARFLIKIIGNEIRKIYGAITTGTPWQFLELEAQTLVLDLEEYSIKNLPQILGILTSFVS
ncbi:hypothetical protein [Okeania sp. SIO2C2]|uniref:hypothetical protein n=1 Tax=Okeania sp. SIO2C2 TaxID=2607787 RepID=UPI00338E460C